MEAKASDGLRKRAHICFEFDLISMSPWETYRCIRICSNKIVLVWVKTGILTFLDLWCRGAEVTPVL